MCGLYLLLSIELPFYMNGNATISSNHCCYLYLYRFVDENHGGGGGIGNDDLYPKRIGFITLWLMLVRNIYYSVAMGLSHFLNELLDGGVLSVLYLKK